jgi:hypothetical protein
MLPFRGYKPALNGFHSLSKMRIAFASRGKPLHEVQHIRSRPPRARGEYECRKPSAVYEDHYPRTSRRRGRVFRRICHLPRVAAAAEYRSRGTAAPEEGGQSNSRVEAPGRSAGLELSCPSCGASAEPGEPFCGECGKSLAGPSTPVAPPDPRSYTPKHLAEKILTSRSALEGERKQVTVLFADVKGSMNIAEQVDPEAWHRIMERFFKILTDGVHRFERTVNQYAGDGIMALFGAPIAHE